MKPSGSGLTYSTYLGGNGWDEGWSVAADNAGNAYISGETDSADFPTTQGAFQTTYIGIGDTFAVKIATPPTFSLSLEQIALPDPVLAGTKLTYQITVTNTGLDRVNNIILIDTLPKNAVFESASSGCTPTGNNLICSLGSLNPGNSKQITIIVKALKAGSITNLVTVASNETDTLLSEITTQVDPVYTVSVNLNSIVSYSLLEARHHSACSLLNFLRQSKGNLITLYVLGGWSVTGVLLRIDDKLAILSNAVLSPPSPINN